MFEEEDSVCFGLPWQIFEEMVKEAYTIVTKED